MSRVRELNDAFRTTLTGGRILVTPGVSALPPDVQVVALRRVATFDTFTEDNDPHGEHDFGSFELAGHRLFWKIDCYDRDLQYGSPDPADPDVTTRVLTILLAEKY